MRRGLILGLVALGALSAIKVHSFGDEYGRPASQIVLRSPLKAPFDSPNAECLRQWREPIPRCLLAFRSQRADAVKLIDLPFCVGCAQAAEFIAGLGLDPDVGDGRRRDVAEAPGAL